MEWDQFVLPQNCRWMKAYKYVKGVNSPRNNKHSFACLIATPCSAQRSFWWCDFVRFVHVNTYARETTYRFTRLDNFCLRLRSHRFANIILKKKILAFLDSERDAVMHQIESRCRLILFHNLHLVPGYEDFGV